MQYDLERINQRLLDVLGDLQRCTGKEVDKLLERAYDPVMQSLLKEMGFDASALSGLMKKTPGLDPYATLGLDKSASDEEVKERYRALLIKLHPDTAGVRGTGFLLQMVLTAYRQIAKERGFG